MDNRERVQWIRQRLQTLDPTELHVADESYKHVGHAGYKTGKGHFRVTITSAHFRGLSRIKAHRLVHTTLGTLMETDIHALALHCRVPDL